MNIANEINNLKGLVAAAFKAGKTANERIDNLPLPMVFKGTLGTGGTITTLPAASSSNEGYVYIVITDGTYAGTSAKAGDTFVSDGSSWVLVPSADEPSVIDDSVTSTALTWSSSKIYNDVAVKTHTYKGTGTDTNTINFPTDWHVLLHVEGMGSNDNNVALAIPIINGVSPYIETVYFRPPNVNVFNTAAITEMTSRALTFQMINSGVALNTLDETFTVLYI